MTRRFGELQSSPAPGPGVPPPGSGLALWLGGSVGGVVVGSAGAELAGGAWVGEA
ncbi:hypothetical protein [Streptomyces sp. NBC_01190]|uniref:hypothetical protein n=1 Tax=Streptomyces sp. NBC_01190 TaxID=2903767 RepID=UPI0038672B1C|nr:hypothetical protein OG519_14255 [Streptomyces sp. NBC_01190]